MSRRSIAGGTALGLVMLTALTLAGSLSSRGTRRIAEPLPPSATNEPGTLSASQPELEQAVLKPVDLGGTHQEVPKATIRQLPNPERCTALLDPSSLLREARVAETTGEAKTDLLGPTDLSQVLASFAGDGADATLRRLRLFGEQCRDFETRLDDGTPVTVHVEEEPVAEDTCALRLTLTGGGQTRSGVLTLRRAGKVLAVLLELGSNDVSKPLRLVDLTLSRLTARS